MSKIAIVRKQIVVRNVDMNGTDYELFMEPNISESMQDIDNYPYYISISRGSSAHADMFLSDEEMEEIFRHWLKLRNSREDAESV